MLESFGVLNLWTYLAGVVFIIILPGPNTLYVLKTGISRGVRAGYTAALGVFIGDAILIFCAYIGVASLIRTTQNRASPSRRGCGSAHPAGRAPPARGTALG